jgi:hypothetical protein
MTLRRVTGVLKSTSLKHSPRRLISGLSAERRRTRLDVADQNRAHAAPSGRFSDHDVKNAIFILFEDEHSKQRAVLTHNPCPVGLTLFPHPVHEPGKVFGTADVLLQADQRTTLPMLARTANLPAPHQ